MIFVRSCYSICIYLFICNQFRTKELVVGEPCDLSGTQGIVGEPPLGIPVNIHITGRLLGIQTEIPQAQQTHTHTHTHTQMLTFSDVMPIVSAYLLLSK